MIRLILGPMMAGKTNMLIRLFMTSPIDSRRAFKAKIDNRYSEGNIVSHDGLQIPATPLENLQNIEDLAKDVDYVYIDEGQFFMDLADKCTILANMGKNVYVSGLNATAQQRPWPSISEVIAVADEIIHISADKCQCCGISMGSHTRVKNRKEMTHMATIKIGGPDCYETVCRSCLFSS